MTSDELTPEDHKELIRAFVGKALNVENPGAIVILAKGADKIGNMVIGDTFEIVGMVEFFKHNLISLRSPSETRIVGGVPHE